MNARLLMRTLLSMGLAAASSAWAIPVLNSEIQLTGYFSNGNFGSRVISNGPTTSVVDDQVSDPGGQIYPGYHWISDGYASASFVPGPPIGGVILGGPKLQSLAKLQLSRAPLFSLFPQFRRDHSVNAKSLYADDVCACATGFAPGTPVMVTLSFGLTGSTSVLFPGQTGGTVAFLPPFTQPSMGSAIFAQSERGFNHVFDSPAVFTFVGEFKADVFELFELTLYATVFSSFSAALDQWGATFEHYASQGISDFSTTMVLTDVDISDMAGTPIAGAQFVGSDGAVWSATPVPEPATALMLVAGLLALLTRISRRTRDATPCRSPS